MKCALKSSTHTRALSRPLPHPRSRHECLRSCPRTRAGLFPSPDLSAELPWHAVRRAVGPSLTAQQWQRAEDGALAASYGTAKGPGTPIPALCQHCSRVLPALGCALSVCLSCLLPSVRRAVWQGEVVPPELITAAFCDTAWEHHWQRAGCPQSSQGCVPDPTTLVPQTGQSGKFSSAPSPG